jgi:CRP-like cAMP-binding protein
MMLDDRPRSASVAALERCELGVIPRADFTAFLLQQPKVALQLIRDLIRLGRGMNVRTREELSSREKLRLYITELEARKPEEAPAVRRWVYAKRAMLAILLTFAALQFYFSDVFLQMMQLGGTLVFTGTP